jgi:hypothetical protein
MEAHTFAVLTIQFILSFKPACFELVSHISIGAFILSEVPGTVKIYLCLPSFTFVPI